MSALATATDQDLVQFLREGRQDAFTEIYNRYKWLLHTHAYKKLGDREAANDLVHELFANLWNQRSTLFLTATLSAYLYTAIRNRALNVIEHRMIESRYADSLMRFANTYEAATDHLAREKQFMAAIEKEILALPPKMRQIFELSRKGHLSHKEIADTLHLSEQTVTRQIKNALRILRIRLRFVLFIAMITGF